jgi:hypothetical protein
MFCLTDRKAHVGGGSLCILRYIEQGEKTGPALCMVETWGMGSCAVMNLYNFTYFLPENAHKGDMKKFVKDLFNWLVTQDEQGHKPKEAFFLLSDSQLSKVSYPFTHALATHPSVKRRDVFSNKSHGPNKVHLFRWSLGKDFKRVTNYG